MNSVCGHKREVWMASKHEEKEAEDKKKEDFFTKIFDNTNLDNKTKHVDIIIITEYHFRYIKTRI